jgi:hypothetical protein
LWYCLADERKWTFGASEGAEIGGVVKAAFPSSFYFMKTIIQLSAEEEAKALPILLRHSTGMILPDRTYVLGEEVVGRLREAGIRFTQLSRETLAPSLEEVAGERV